MTSMLPRACDSCSRIRGGDDSMRCDAYPSGIPDDIGLFGIDPHTALRGDEEVPMAYDRNPDRAREYEEYQQFLQAMAEETV